ncbi:MAG: SMODS domain-containing nucleotidyltransferase [Planctomycetota bacterium]|jgi:hypothetical protein
MKMNTYFADFVRYISPTTAQKTAMAREHRKLRELLQADAKLKPFLLSTFIQGSQRRFTAQRGSREHPCDVDIVAVTNIPRGPETAPIAHGIFQPFLEEHYKGVYEAQDRSWCIQVDEDVKLDLVPTSEPDSLQLREVIKAARLTEWAVDEYASNGDDFQSVQKLLLAEATQDKDWEHADPIWIPDRKLAVWEQTHPLHLIAWTAKKNLSCNGHFAHVVRCIRWWRRHAAPMPERPKGYPLEHMVADCTPSGITSVAEGLARAFREMANRYAADAAARRVPFLASRGVSNPEIDVMRRITGNDFAAFHQHVLAAASLAERALEASTTSESSRLWRQLLPNFPLVADATPAAATGFTQPDRPATPREGRFA